VPRRAASTIFHADPQTEDYIVRLLARRTQETETVRRRRRSQGPTAPQFYVTPVGSLPSEAEDQPRVPDLLHAQPLPWGDLTGSVELVRYGFEGGDCTGVFDTLIEALPLSSTGFVKDSFASQLYLDELVDKCLALRLSDPQLQPNRRLLRHILTTPPRSMPDCATRQAVVAELAEKPRMREDLTRFYVALRALRRALEVEATEEPNFVRRKIGVLVALQAAVNALAEGFEGATSVLSRLRASGERVRGQESWARMAQLVDLEGNLAAVDVRLRLGSDGTVRAFGILEVRERHAPDLLPGPFARWMRRISGFFRGHRYGESEVVVRLLDEVFSPFAEEVVALLATTGAVELYLSTLSFSDLAQEKGLSVCLPTLSPPGASKATRHIEGLFNPLLFLQSASVRTCDVPVPEKDALVVITGPNSGGKTRFLQAIALTQLLGQVGIFVPAARASLVIAPNLFLSLVTDGDAGQVEGRLGTELLRIRKLFEELETGSLAILDELCSGTNPNEGEEIFEMVLSLLPRLSPQLFVSTHFLGLAQRLEKERPVKTLSFLQVELDAEERPTYQFVPGVATTSLAHKVAARLGVTKDELEALVTKKLGPQA
jgi:DNA mismatch repair protein MutS2